MRNARQVVLSSSQIVAVVGAGLPVSGVALGQIEFEELSLFPAPSLVTGVAVLDLNRDGYMDLAFCEEERAIHFLESDGDQFTLTGSLYRPGATLRDLQGVELNGDKYVDLVWIEEQAGSYRVSRLYDRGNGRVGRLEFTELGTRPPARVVFGDVTGDGAPDMVVVAGFQFASHPSSISIYENEGGAFSLSQTLVLEDDAGRDVVVGDLDNDGDADLAVLTADIDKNNYNNWKIYHSEIGIFLNDGLGTFSPGVRIELPYGQGGDYDPLPHAMVGADFDGDGDRDLAVATSDVNSDSEVFLQRIESVEYGREFVLLDPLVFGVARGESRIAAGDLDVDGDIDVLLSVRNHELWAGENTGGGEFTSTLMAARRLFNPGPVLTDFNNDGLLDWASPGYPGCVVYLNVTAYFGPVLEYAPLVRGQRATLTVSNALPGELVSFLSTIQGLGNSLGVRQLGGITLDLNDPIQILGTARADSNGVAQFRFTVPPRAPLTEVVLQAVIRRGPGGADSVKTPFRTARIRE